MKSLKCFEENLTDDDNPQLSSEIEIRKWKTRDSVSEKIIKKSFEIWINSDPNNDAVHAVKQLNIFQLNFKYFDLHFRRRTLKIPSSSDESLRMPPQMEVTIFFFESWTEFCINKFSLFSAYQQWPGSSQQCCGRTPTHALSDHKSDTALSADRRVKRSAVGCNL